MRKAIKYVMQVLYANNKYARYKTDGAGYYIAVVGAAFYIFISLFLAFVLCSSAFPALYKSVFNIRIKINVYLFALSYMLLSSLALKFLIKEKDITNIALTKEQVNKAVNFLLLYLFLAGAAIVYFIMHYLRPLHNAFP